MSDADDVFSGIRAARVPPRSMSSATALGHVIGSIANARDASRLLGGLAHLGNHGGAHVSMGLVEYVHDAAQCLGVEVSTVAKVAGFELMTNEWSPED